MEFSFIVEVRIKERVFYGFFFKKKYFEKKIARLLSPKKAKNNNNNSHFQVFWKTSASKTCKCTHEEVFSE